ncbi:hypothetical protein AJ79_09721 [Helicocarpus griseus UAMH5409]|uniref:Uncharacterized protein n=1 Tax=Helicocarpus griseus UAMH5409 TaxID=1447875 RepID=A0A2B7WHQ3_9EURO|nr:hypothetical protein AJ79_09721 [Helicocarpus griseus UAMH5409]
MTDQQHGSTRAATEEYGPRNEAAPASYFEAGFQLGNPNYYVPYAPLPPVQPGEATAPVGTNTAGSDEETCISHNATFPMSRSMIPFHYELTDSVQSSCPTGGLQAQYACFQPGYSPRIADLFRYDKVHVQGQNHSSIGISSPLQNISPASLEDKSFHTFPSSNAQLLGCQENTSGNDFEFITTPDSCHRSVGMGHDFTRDAQITTEDLSEAIGTNYSHSMHSQLGDGRSPMSLAPTGISRSRVARRSLSSSPSNSRLNRRNKPKPAGRPFGEIAFHAKSGEPAAVGPNRGPRPYHDKLITAVIRKLGGACDSCRRNHRGCKLEHHPLNDVISAIDTMGNIERHQLKDVISALNALSSSDQSPTASFQRASAFSSNLQGQSHQTALTPATNSFISASSPPMQQDAATPSEAAAQDARGGNFNIRRDIAEVGCQFLDTRDMIPETVGSIDLYQDDMSFEWDTLDSIQEECFHAEGLNFDDHQSQSSFVVQNYENDSGEIGDYIAASGEVSGSQVSILQLLTERGFHRD